LHGECVAGGRRARELKVPGKWGGNAGDDGVYMLMASEDGRVEVQDRCSTIAHAIPEEDMLKDINGQVLDIEDLRIDFNFAAEKAKVVSDKSTDSILIISMGNFGRKGKRLSALLAAAVDAERCLGGKRAPRAERKDKAENSDAGADGEPGSGMAAPLESSVEANLKPAVPPEIMAAMAAKRLRSASDTVSDGIAKARRTAKAAPPAVVAAKEEVDDDSFLGRKLADELSNA
jgi:hypothetical protein